MCCCALGWVHISTVPELICMYMLFCDTCCWRKYAESFVTNKKKIKRQRNKISTFLSFLLWDDWLNTYILHFVYNSDFQHLLESSSLVSNFEPGFFRVFPSSSSSDLICLNPSEANTNNVIIEPETRRSIIVWLYVLFCYLDIYTIPNDENPIDAI